MGEGKKEKRKPAGWWTEARIADEPARFSTRAAFAEGSGSAYNAAQRLRILDRVCKHMEPARQSWTDDAIAEAASRFSTRKTFQSGCGGAYGAALRRGILDKVCAHMELARQSWTDDAIAAEALKYATRGAFAEGSGNAYQAARARGRAFVERVCGHMAKPKNKPLTDEQIIRAAGQCRSLKQFHTGFSGAYNAARRRSPAFFASVTTDLERSKYGPKPAQRPAASKQTTAHTHAPTET